MLAANSIAKNNPRYCAYIRAAITHWVFAVMQTFSCAFVFRGICSAAQPFGISTFFFISYLPTTTNKMTASEAT